MDSENLKKQGIIYDNDNHAYKSAKSMSARHHWTILTKYPESKRGEYEDEIDVVTYVRTVSVAKKIAQAVLDDLYVPELRIARVVLNY